MSSSTQSGRHGAVLAVVGTLLVGAIGVTAGAASAGTAAKHKTEAFVVGGANGHEQFIAHGALVGSGKDDASHDEYDVLHFPNGTLRVTHPDKDSTFKSHVNAKTCYGTFTLTGAYTLGHGTGKYRGVKGHGTYKGVGYVLARKTKSGSCNENAEPITEIFSVQGHGPITLP